MSFGLSGYGVNRRRVSPPVPRRRVGVGELGSLGESSSLGFAGRIKFATPFCWNQRRMDR